MAVPATMLLSYALMAVDEIASVIESPFQGYLPLLALWAELRKDVCALVESSCFEIMMSKKAESEKSSEGEGSSSNLAAETRAAVESFTPVYQEP